MPPPKYPIKISIVIATLNAAQHLNACLDSCVRQTFKQKEIILIDGGSTDGTIEVIKDYSSEIAYWISEPDRGIYDAWNKAIGQVTGSWVLFRGADDLFWDDSTLEKAACELDSVSSRQLLCYGNIVSVGSDQELVDVHGRPWTECKPLFSRKMAIPHTGLFHHVRLFEEFGLFDPTFRIAGDYDFLLRVLSSGDVDAKYVKNLIITRMQNGGVSHNQGLLTKKESIRALKKNGVKGLAYAQYREILQILSRAWRLKILGKMLGRETINNLRKQRQLSREGRLKKQIDLIQSQ